MDDDSGSGDVIQQSEPDTLTWVGYAGIIAVVLMILYLFDRKFAKRRQKPSPVDPPGTIIRRINLVTMPDSDSGTNDMELQLLEEAESKTD